MTAEGTPRPFDLIGERYDAASTDRSVQIAETDWLIGEVAAGGTVLDLGCGSGVPTAKRLADAGLSVVGVDESATMLGLSRQRVPAATFLHQDMRELPSGEFDGATAFFSLLMLPRADIEGLLVSLRERMRGPKVLAIAMVAGELDDAPGIFLDVPARFSAYPADELADVVRAAGYDVLSVREQEALIGPDHLETQIYLRARVRPRV